MHDFAYTLEQKGARTLLSKSGTNGSADKTYASLGRALSFATRLERNCLALAVLVELRTNSLISQDENTLRDFCAFLHKRRLSNSQHLPDDVFAVLDEARQARDHITHKAAIDIEAQLKTDDRHTQMLDNLSTAVRKMAEAVSQPRGFSDIMTKLESTV